MTVTIQVKPELAHRWQEIAESEGRELEAVIADAMEEHRARNAAEDAEDIADTLCALADNSEPNVPWSQIESEMKAEQTA